MRNVQGRPEVNIEAAPARKTSLSLPPTSAPPASLGIPFSKTDWPKHSAPTSPFSLWLLPHNVVASLASFDPATPPRRTVSSAIPKSSKPPAILSASASTPMRVKRLKKSSAATLMVASQTPPFASSHRTARRSSPGVAVAQTRFSAATSFRPLEKLPITLNPKARPRKQLSPTSPISALGSMFPQPTSGSSSWSPAPKTKSPLPGSLLPQSVTTQRLSENSTMISKPTPKPGPAFSPAIDQSPGSKLSFPTPTAKKERS